MEDDEHGLEGRVSAAGLLKISSPTLAAIRAAVDRLTTLPD